MLRNPDNLTYRDVILSEAAYGGLPLAYWPLDEVNGATAHDQIARYNGTIIGGVTLGLPGPINREKSRGVGLDGTSGYISCPAGAQWELGAFTLEAWMVSAASGAAQRIIELPEALGPGNDAYSIALSAAGNLNGLIRNTSGAFYSISSSGTFNDGKFHHVAASFGGSKLTIYADGAIVGSTATSGVIQYISTNLLIGQFGGTWGQWFSGTLSHVAIYPYALAADRIQFHYLAGLNGVKQ